MRRSLKLIKRLIATGQCPYAQNSTATAFSFGDCVARFEVNPLNPTHVVWGAKVCAMYQALAEQAAEAHVFDPNWAVFQTPRFMIYTSNDNMGVS